MARSGVPQSSRSSDVAAPAIRPKPVYQRARLSLAAGKVAKVGVCVRLTSGGLLAIGGLVSAILLSTAVLVRVAVRESRRPPGS